MEKQKTVQLTLPEVMSESEEVEENLFKRTDAFEIKTKQSQIDKYIEKLEAVKKNGEAKFTEYEKNIMKIDWVQSRMKAKTTKNISGDEYFSAKRAFTKKIFNLDAADILNEVEPIV